MDWIKHINILTAIITIVTVQQATAQTPTLSLTDCRKMALEQNKKIKAAQYQVDAARAAHEAARLNDRPSLNASVMGIHAGKPLDNLIPQFVGNASLDVQQPLYAGGKIKLGREATAKAVEVYEGQKAITETDVLLAVETAYWQVVQVKEKIVLATRYKAMLQQLHADLEHSFNAGLIYKNDLLRVEVSLNEAELNITKAQDGFEMARLNLAQLTGQPGNINFSVSDSVGGQFNPLPATSFQNSYGRRPEINTLTKAIEAEQIQTKIIKADLHPTLGISASGIGATGKRINFSNGKDHMLTYYALVNLSVPVFDWGKNRQKVKEQVYRIQARQTELEETKELISLQVQNALLQLNESAQTVKLMALSLQQADENLRLANDRYKAGTIIGKDVLEAQAIWQQAYTGVIDAQVEYRINEARYLKATGELK